MNEGIKYDAGKPRWGLLPYDALEEVVKVLTFGAQKYEDRNWENGISFSRLFDAAQRHQKAWWQDRVDMDAETGTNHLANAITDLLFILAYQLRGMPEWDDRPDRIKKEKEKEEQSVKKIHNIVATPGRIIRHRYDIDYD